MSAGLLIFSKRPDKCRRACFFAAGGFTIVETLANFYEERKENIVRRVIAAGAVYTQRPGQGASEKDARLRLAAVYIKTVPCRKGKVFCRIGLADRKPFLGAKNPVVLATLDTAVPSKSSPDATSPADTGGILRVPVQFPAKRIPGGEEVGHELLLGYYYFIFPFVGHNCLFFVPAPVSLRDAGR